MTSTLCLAGATMGFVPETQSPGHGGPEPPHSRTSACLSLESAAVSLISASALLSLFLCCPRAVSAAATPILLSPGGRRSGQTWAESPVVRPTPHTGAHGEMAVGPGGPTPGRALSLSVSVSALALFLCLSHPVGTQSKDLPLCVCVNQGRLPGGVRAGAPQRPGESLSHRGSWYLGGGESTRWSTPLNPLLLSPRG